MIRWCDQHVVVVVFFFRPERLQYSIPNSTLLASPGDAVSARPRRSIFHGVSPVLAFASAPPAASLPPALLLGPAHPSSPILCAGPASVLRPVPPPVTTHICLFYPVPFGCSFFHLLRLWVLWSFGFSWKGFGLWAGLYCTCLL